MSQRTTRAKLLEPVLKAEEFPVGGGLVGRVAQIGRGELLANAAADPPIVKHRDEVLTVRCVIAVPRRFRERFFGCGRSRIRRPNRRSASGTLP